MTVDEWSETIAMRDALQARLARLYAGDAPAEPAPADVLAAVARAGAGAEAAHEAAAARRAEQAAPADLAVLRALLGEGSDRALDDLRAFLDVEDAAPLVLSPNLSLAVRACAEAENRDPHALLAEMVSRQLTAGDAPAGLFGEMA